MPRYVNKTDITDTHATVSISGPPELARAIWDLITRTGIYAAVTESGEISGFRPAYITDGEFSDNRRAPGEIQIRYAKLIYHTEMS